MPLLIPYMCPLRCARHARVVFAILDAAYSHTNTHTNHVYACNRSCRNLHHALSPLRNFCCIFCTLFYYYFLALDVAVGFLRALPKAVHATAFVLFFLFSTYFLFCFTFVPCQTASRMLRKPPAAYICPARG